jgi:Tfp pilus assembly protein PilF
MLGSIYFQTDKAMALKYYEKAYLLDSKDANVLNNFMCIVDNEAISIQQTSI